MLDAPLGETTLPLSGVVAITDDEQGIATELAASLRRRGIEVALIRDDDRDSDSAGYAARLGDTAAAHALVESIHRQQGRISALVHLLPLRAGPPFEELDVDGWQNLLDQETRALLHLAQAMRADLRRPGSTTRLLAAIRLDGAFGQHRTGTTSSPSHGGVAGLVKTLALEWPEVTCRVVDLDPAITDAAERLAAELHADDDRVEVGWSGDRRITIGLVPAPLAARGPEPPLDADCVVVVTGGARGITARVTCELARRYRPTVILLGRSPMPDAGEPADTAGITDPRTLKAALAARLQRDGAPATPSQVEPAYRRLLADREMRTTLSAITAAGARVHYHQVDVRDPEALTRLVADVYTVHGRIDGVVHGAGVIEDKLIEDKTTESFDRVLDTKALGAFVLARALRPESLRLFVLFSSISARFGNPGQGDYAAANEVLNKLAGWLDARWPGRVTSLLWGPWQTAGMVSDEVQRRFAQRGIELIDPDRGAVALVNELERGGKGDVEVLLGAGPWQLAPPQLAAIPLVTSPLLVGATTTPVPDGIEITRTLDPERDRYLGDHRLDGHPVLPAAAAMEFMAEVAAAARPDHEVTELRDVQILKGVILDDGPRAVTVRTAAARSLDDGSGLKDCGLKGCVLDVTVLDSRTGRTAYRAEVVLRDALPTAPLDTARSAGALEPYPVPLERVYDELLFHGPLMRGITHIEGIGDDGMVATLAPSRPQECLTRGEGSWIIDPVLIDSGFQLCILWARARLDMTPLPARIRRYRRFAAVPDAPVRCEMHARVRPGGHLLDTQYAFRDARGRLLAVIEDMEGACSRSLNRLAGGGEL